MYNGRAELYPPLIHLQRGVSPMCRPIIKQVAATVLIIAFLFVQNASGAVPPGPTISAPSAILIDSIQGQVLYGKDTGRKVPLSIASKVMTMLLAIEKSTPEAKITISKESAETDGSLLNLEAGEKYTVEDLLYATMLTSANDTANALAEFIGGDIAKFVEMMNEKSKVLDLKNTHFVNPSGLYHQDQYTTAQDMAILMRTALKNPVFNIIFSTSAKPWSSKSGSQVLISQNKLFWWGYEGVDGGKIGVGDNGMQSAVTTATREGLRLICITLGAKQDAVFHDTIKQLDYGFNNFRKGLLVAKDSILKNMPFGDHELALSSLENVYYTYPIGDSYIKNIEFSIKKDLKPPITQDLIVGTARYTLTDGTVIDVSLCSGNEIHPPSRWFDLIKSRLLENKDIFYFLIVLCAIEGLIILANIVRFIKKRVYR